MRNGYAIRINQVSTYINDHLQQTLSLEALARVAGFSPYHFHRLFKKETGETLNEFVTRRRLERAIALMKASRRLSLTQIAIECGFSELSDFSRAYKQRYGISPNQWDRSQPLQESKIRQAPTALPVYTSAEMAALQLDPAFEVTLRDVPALRLAYIRVTNAYAQPDAIMEAYRVLPSWVDARAQRGKLIGMSEDDPNVTPPALYRYDVCMAVPAALQADDVVAIRTLPAHTLATIHCVGDIAQVDKTWQFLFRQWLPNSGFLPDNLPMMEIYCWTPDEIGWESFDLECAIAVVKE